MPLICGAVFERVTSILNAGKALDTVPSDTLITIPLLIPTSVADGVPVKAPFAVLKLAQAGLLLMLKVS